MGYHEKDNANSTQDLNDAGSVFRQYSDEFWFSDMDFSNCEKPHEDRERGVQKQDSGGRGTASKERAPNVDRKADRFYDLRLLQDQRRTTREPLARTTCGTMSCETAT